MATNLPANPAAMEAMHELFARDAIAYLKATQSRRRHRRRLRIWLEPIRWPFPPKPTGVRVFNGRLR